MLIGLDDVDEGMNRRQWLGAIMKIGALVSASVGANPFADEAQATSTTPKGYGGEKGRWVPVPRERFGTAPFNRICLVQGYSNGTPAKGGTGWLHSPGVILTAAHVVAGGAKARVQFPDQTTWTQVTVQSIAKGYRASNGEEQECSPADLAMLVAPPNLAIPFNTFELLMAAQSTAIGYHDGVLVRHSGLWKDIGPFIGHNCDTDQGHSGCPLFVGSNVHGIHVGLFSGSRNYLTGSNTQVRGYLNSAVRLDSTVLDALISI